MPRQLTIAFFGSSLVSAYWNGAATYYRGIVRALFERGHHVVFFEPDAFDRQKNRDIPDPEWARVVVYPSETEADIYDILRQVDSFDVIVKASGVGVFDELLEREILAHKRKGNIIVFWDVDAPATLERLTAHKDDPFIGLIPHYDLILTYGGGKPVMQAYGLFGARKCVPIYNALDPSTHFPVASEKRFGSDLTLLANRLPDRESRIDEFFFRPAALLPNHHFLLGGSGWADKHMPGNVRYAGHIYTKDHNTFNCSSLAVLNVSRDSMAKLGYSPATRVFEATGAGACLITDYWLGIEQFFEPDKEILIAHDGNDVASIVHDLTPQKARMIGDAALKRVLSEHTYARRVVELELQLVGHLEKEG